MAKQKYANPETLAEVWLETASTLIQLPNSCQKEWVEAYISGELSKIIISNGRIHLQEYDGFHLDVDTRRVDSDEEIHIDLARLLPPFINVGVLFAINNDYNPFSIGPHMNENPELKFSKQLVELIKKNPGIEKELISKNIPLTLCIKEPYLLGLSPDQFIFDDKQLYEAIKVLEYYSAKGKKFWPVSICIEPLPLKSVEETLTCRSTWTNNLSQAWFEAEHLISKYCPEASLGGRFSKLLNLSIALYHWTEVMDIGSIEEDELNGSPILALQNIVAEWRSWSRIHNIEIQRSRVPDFVPNWNIESVKDLRNTLDNPAMDALLLSFTKQKITSDQQSVISGLTHQYNFAYNPLAVAGIEIVDIVLKQSIHSPGAAWCINTSTSRQEDGFNSIEKCGQVLVRNLKSDVVYPRKCNDTKCLFGEGLTIEQIYKRQKEIDDCIGNEQCFGVVSGSSKPISTLWKLCKNYLYIVDRYFKEESLIHLQSIPQGIEVKILLSDDDQRGVARRNKLRQSLKNNTYPFVEIKVVTCTHGASSHPLHDRYVFSSDWGASLSSSLDAINSNALWVFKLEDYQKLQQIYFEYFWTKPLGSAVQYGNRSFTVNNLF